MSQSRDKEGDEHPDQFQANNALAVMLDHGMSISGQERHCVFLNTGADNRSGEKFACISAVSGLDFPDDGRGVSVVDWDSDGDQDLWVSNRNAPRIRYFRNDTHTGNNYITLQLVGNGSTTSRDAVGARVEIFLDPQTNQESPETDKTTNPSRANKLIKTVHIGQGFLSQSSRWLHFGIGDASKISKVTVQWPGGELEEFENLEINQRYEIHQDGKLVLVPSPSVAPPLPASSPKLPEPADRFRVPLVAIVPMPDFPYRDASGQIKGLLDAKGDGMLLINCWSTTCIPCLKELKEFTDHAQELRDENINVLALCLDAANGETDPESSPNEVLKNMGFPFSYGEATSNLGGALSSIHNVMTATGGLLPVPTSFLVDASGHLVAIYKGPVTVETLIADKDHSSLPPWERFRRAANLPGTVIENDVLEKALTKGDHFARTHLAHHLEEQGWSHAASIQHEALAKKLPDSEEKKTALSNVFFERGLLLARQKNWESALESFEQSLENKKSAPASHHNLGICLQKLGRTDQARSEYEEALRLQPSLIAARANLGRLLAQEKDWLQAEIEFQKVATARPKDATNIYNLGVSLAMQQKWELAIVQFNRVLKLKPDFSQAKEYLERIRVKTTSKDPA
jgi:Flp pilus assembly protein TadD/peroxiredoxin